jgi:hypothetical protein
MCSACKAYNLDYSSIHADLHYIMHEAAVEKKEWNGVRDCGRAGLRLEDFAELPQAKAAKLKKEEVAGLRFYTSHSFNALNIPMRDQERQGLRILLSLIRSGGGVFQEDCICSLLEVLCSHATLKYLMHSLWLVILQMAHL